MCPLVSSIGTHNYHLSTFLTDLPDLIIPTSHCTKDSFTSCEEIKKVIATNKFLISYKVCSLFTSIPLKETINIAVNLLFEHNLNLNITKAEFKKKIDIRYIFSFLKYVLRPNRWCCNGFYLWSCPG